MRKSGDGKKSIVQKKANVFEIGPKKAEEPVIEAPKEVVEKKQEEPVAPAAPAAPAMDLAALAQQMAAIQALLSGNLVAQPPAPVAGVDMVAVEREGEPEPEPEVVEEPEVEEQVEEQVDDATEQADDESTDSSSEDVPIEIVDPKTPQMVLMCKFYRDIFDNFNWLKKFKDDGRLILTPNQLVAFIALVCDIDRSCIRIQCDMKPRRSYSDGKIYKVVKIGIETEKEIPDLDKVFRTYNISPEYINYSEKLMTIEY